jgi:hypothetical protein
MHTPHVTVATSESRMQPEPENFLGYRDSSSKSKSFDELLSGSAFAVIAIICLAIGAIALLA